MYNQKHIEFEVKTDVDLHWYYSVSVKSYRPYLNFLRSNLLSTVTIKSPNSYKNIYSTCLKVLLLLPSFLNVFCIFNWHIFILLPEIQRIKKIEDCTFSFSNYAAEARSFN